MKKIFILILSALFFESFSSAQQEQLLKVGDKAPDFSLPYATKDSVSRNKIQLSSQIGKENIIIAFYPADWSGGCTKEVCTLRDNFSSLSQLNAKVFGISGDYIFSHHEWAKFHNLPFILLSDHDHQTAKKYNSYNSDYGYNKRTVYLIDPGGVVSYIDLNYSTSDEKSFKKLRTALEGMKK
jgi:peroxiredoxin